MGLFFSPLKKFAITITGMGEVAYLEIVTKRNVEELFYRVKTNDKKAFEHLFFIYFPRLNDFARKVVKDPSVSKDIVQEVFVKIWERRDAIECINIEALIFKMVRNSCIDHIHHLRVVQRSMQKMQSDSGLEELFRIDFVGDEPYLLLEEELKIRIDKVIHNLPERCREVFLLSRVNGLKNREIAERLHINVKNVERHIHRALQAFKHSLPLELPMVLVITVLQHFYRN